MPAKKKILGVPQVNELVKPTVQALLSLGGSGNIQEINDKVYDLTKLPEEILNIPHSKDGRTQIDYRLAWARTRLRLQGLLENSSRGVWTLTNPNINIDDLDIDENQKKFDRNRRTTTDKLKDLPIDETFANSVEGADDENADWKEILIKKLYTIRPDSFERLAQQMLRESGFIQVEVTGKTGDGGIDGKGIVRISGFLSFHVIFQCKRYKGSITPSQVRDFRGAMQGRTDKGIFITTGTFTRDARKEATREGAFPIDLIDGNLLCDKLKELELGVKTELVEHVVIENGWFDLL
ncbi:restriction endonuclease [Mucilaginibacter kameinonensis]|uniref:restriction endonuclease n=1 Tax=Mucilaginibacter kameinonensis TaxID=452286 RepID=UPI000EF7ABF8|nr:restriction endonuclease [Mucilaginibacter kameinonensis]